MKNYRDSDYAVNKYAAGIVYRFAGQTLEVTLEDFLAENPDRTEQDFLELKALSDEIYFQQDRDDNAQTKKNVSIHGMEETRDLGCIPIDEQYIEIQDKRYATEAIAQLLESGALTETQRRRFVLHIIKGQSLREIAKNEKVHFTSVDESLRSAMDKLKKLSANF